MAKELCSNCDAKMTQRVSFCPTCGSPTRYASEAEHLDWDLGQWRKHVERSVAAGPVAPAPIVRGSVAIDSRRRPAPDLEVIVAPEPDAKPARVRRKMVMPRIAKPKLRLPVRLPTEKREEHEQDRVIILDADHSFVYTACTSCDRADWVIRTTRNEDRTYNYWCVRCSRSFKTDARIRQAFKPFITAGSVIGALATLSIVMR